MPIKYSRNFDSLVSNIFSLNSQRNTGMSNSQVALVVKNLPPRAVDLRSHRVRYWNNSMDSQLVLVVKKKKSACQRRRTWKTPVWDLGQEDRLEGEMIPHSRILAGRILWIEMPGGSSDRGGLKVVRHNWASEYNRLNECNLGKFIFRFSKVWLNAHQKTTLLQPNQKPSSLFSL